MITSTSLPNFSNVRGPAGASERPCPRVSYLTMRIDGFSRWTSSSHMPQLAPSELLSIRQAVAFRARHFDRKCDAWVHRDADHATIRFAHPCRPRLPGRRIPCATPRRSGLRDAWRRWRGSAGRPLRPAPQFPRPPCRRGGMLRRRPNSMSKRAVPLPWPSEPAPETLMLQLRGASLSESAISPSNEPPTAATRNCISTL